MALAENKVSFGLSNGHYAVATQSKTGTYTFGDVKELPGLISMSASVVGGKNDVYADNKIIATLTSYAGQELTLTMSEIPEQFKLDVLGYEKDTEGGLCEITNAQSKTFALGFQVEGDVKARRTWLFLCTATNPADSSETKTDTPAVNNPELVITIRPIETSGRELLKRTMAVGETAYTDFFKSVSLPTFTASQL